MKKKTLPIEERLADAADVEGITVEDLATDAKLLRRYRIDQKRLTGALIHRARDLNTQRMQELLARVNAMNAANNPQPTEVLTTTQGEEEMTTITKTNKTNKTRKNTETKGEKTPVTKKVKKEAKAERSLVFDKYAGTAVVRWMGAKGWDFDIAKRVCAKMMPNIAEATIRIQLNAGKNGLRGEPAGLNRDEQKTLNGLKKS